MGRPIPARESYAKDRVFLAKLEVAVMRDTRVTEPKKGTILGLIRSLAREFMALDGRDPPGRSQNAGAKQASEAKPIGSAASTK